MPSIQQSLNQMLSVGAIGAGLYVKSPAHELKQKIKQENVQELAHKRTLADYEETISGLDPSEYPGKDTVERQEVEKAARGLYDIQQARYLREPTMENWESRYLAGVESDEYQRLGQSLTRRTQTLQNQRQGLDERRERIRNGGNQ